MFGLIIHGGAWGIPDEEVTAHHQGCALAVERGFLELRTGGSAVRAAVQAVQTMEDDPTFDAGVGSFLSFDGDITLDAAVMTASDLKAGCLAGVHRLRNPVLAAEFLRTDDESVFLIGEGAEEFAESKGISLCDPQDLKVDREVERWRRGRRSPGDGLDSFGGHPASDTVGAVAIDSSGEVAVAVSTGGRPLKRKGRVGDSPIIGAGDDRTAASSRSRLRVQHAENGDRVLDFRDGRADREGR